MWDVGAHHGLFSLLCARHGAARVLAVEPDGRNCAVLQRHLDANPSLAARIDVLCAAVSDRDGDVEFVTSSSDGTLNQIRVPGVPQYAHGAAATRSTVPARSVDSLVASRGVVPGLLKIDVEGAEALVLAGAARLLATGRPVVLVEIHNQAAGEACVRQLTAAGFACSRLRPDGTTAPINSDLSYGHLLARPGRTDE